ncbi:MAG: tRNA lysidine(34) synthetase TilS [Desulfobacteraceae bacterium]
MAYTAMKTIDRYNMIDFKDSLLLGVSGGPDSVALFLFLVEISEEFQLKLGVAHVNHNLRGNDSHRDAVFVQSLTEKYRLPFFLLDEDVKTIAETRRKSLEETAREVRYAFFKKICSQEKFLKLALGHTRNDNAEQVLMNFLRGSGTAGLCGIPPVRDHWVVRPLIDISRKTILEFLEEKAQNYVMDQSNQDQCFLRNRIRHSLLPCLQKNYNPNIIDSLNRLSRILKDDHQWMEKEAAYYFTRALKLKTRKRVELSLTAFKQMDPALAKRVVRHAIKEVKNNLRRITLVHIEAVTALIFSREKGKSLDLPDRIRVFITKEGICIKKEDMDLRRLGRLKKEGKVFLA